MLFEAGHAPALGVETRHKTRLVSPIRHHSSTFAVGEPAAYATGSPELKAVGPCLAVSNSPITRGVLVIIPRREGRERWNHLNALPIQAIHERWISQYAGHAMNVLSALKSELEG